MTDQTARLLAEIPALAAQLRPFLIPSNNPGSDGPRPAPTSRPPLNVDLLDLIAGRELSYWVMLAIDEMTEQGTEPTNPPSSREPTITDNCTWLTNNADWITEHNPDAPEITNRKTGKTVPAFTGFPTAIRQLHAAYQRAAGNIPGPKISCPKCGNSAFIEGEWLICREVEEHARTVKDIEHDYRRRPAMTPDDLSNEFQVTAQQLHEWTRRGKLHAAGDHKTGGRGRPKKIFWPWDVFLLQNPTIAEALEARDAVMA